MEKRKYSVLSAGLVGALLLVAVYAAPRVWAASDLAGGQSKCVFDHSMLRSTPATCRPHAVDYPSDVIGKVRHAIYDSALTFGIPYSVLERIAQCESGLDPKARLAGHFGLFQFLPATFHGGARQMRQETGIGAKSYWNPWDSAYVAGYLFATGMSDSWTCQ